MCVCMYVCTYVRTPPLPLATTKGFPTKIFQSLIFWGGGWVALYFWDLRVSTRFLAPNGKIVPRRERPTVLVPHAAGLGRLELHARAEPIRPSFQLARLTRREFVP